MTDRAESLHEFVVRREQAGQRLDRLLSAELGSVGRSALRKLFSDGAVLVVRAAGRPRRAAKGEPAEEGWLVQVDLGQVTQPASLIAAEADPTLSLRVVLEREDLVVVDKPAGQPTAPLGVGERGTLVSGLLARYPEMAGHGYRPGEPGLCHRLDTGTSGLLLAARTPHAFAVLTEALRAGRIHKRYLLICPADVLPDRGEVDWPIAPHPRNPRRVLVCTGPHPERGARPARTRFRVLKRRGRSVLVEARAPRAVRHQIRAHLAALGAPIHGDRTYGSAIALPLGRHALHASQINWTGEAGLEGFRVRSPLPPELRALL